VLDVLTSIIKSSVKFCVDEVFEGRGGIDMRRIRRGKSSSLGMPRKASHLSSSTIISMFRFLFCSHDMRKFLERLLCLFPFLFYAPCWYEIVLGWFIECSLHFSYIFWVWLYRILHVLHLYYLKFGCLFLYIRKTIICRMLFCLTYIY
jgi:hypothetical protein